MVRIREISKFQLVFNLLAILLCFILLPVCVHLKQGFKHFKDWVFTSLLCHLPDEEESLAFNQAGKHSIKLIIFSSLSAIN